MSNNGQAGGVGIGVVLFLVFLVLKLTGTIDWSWWWITAPLWAPWVIFGAVLVGLGIITLALAPLIAARRRHRGR